MKKIALSITLIFCFIQNIKSQIGPPMGGISGLIVALSQRSTVLYSDTIFEIDQLKFKITETYAFRDKIKTTIILYNQSDNFKIIHSEDFTITDSENNAIIVNAKKPIVIAPKTSKKIGLLAETKASFKLYDIKIELKKIYTTGNPVAIFKPNLFNLQLEGMEASKVGPLEITRTKCLHTPDGITKAYFKVAYTGNKFLGIYRPKAMLLSPNGKAYMNIAKKASIISYPEEKAAMTLLFEYYNHAVNFSGQNCDKISFENVFVEYEPTSNSTPLEIHVYKNGLNEGDSPSDKKEREDIED
jgi:hypothetical protein